MIKDKNSLNDSFKSYAFIEFFDLEDAKKALDALGKGEIKLREEVSLNISSNFITIKVLILMKFIYFKFLHSWKA